MESKSLKKIIIEAERIKFGRGAHARLAKSDFMDGFIWCMKRVEGGAEALKERGYNLGD